MPNRPFQHSDFMDSVVVEELDMDTIPMELLEAFENSQIGHIREETLEPDFWSRQTRNRD